MINFYRRFIPHAVSNQYQMFNLIKGNKKNDNTLIIWTPEADDAFEKCKADLANATILVYPYHKLQLSIMVVASD